MEYAIESWFERDRAYVGLYTLDDTGAPDMNSESIIEFWDDGVNGAIEDGILDPRDYLGSMIDYAKYMGLINS